MIVVFGSLNLDLVFRAHRLPRPGETVIGASFEQHPGGKGLNQAVAAARARRPDGPPVRFAGAIGRDGFAARLEAALDEPGLERGWLAAVDGASGCAGIVVDAGGENAIVVAGGANLAARARQVPDDALGTGTTLLLQMEVAPEEIATLMLRAERRGTRTLLNLAPATPLPERVLRAANLLVLNALELAALAGQCGLAPGEPDDFGRALAQRLGVRVVTSLGAEGAVAAAGPLAWRIGALPITPVDSTGAGDAFVGALAVALDEGKALPEALRFAAVAGGLACLKPGAAPSMPSRAAIEARLCALAPAEPL
jgi:ribokinase